MAHQNIYIGSIGEGIAINHLSSLGYSIRQRNLYDYSEIFERRWN